MAGFALNNITDCYLGNSQVTGIFLGNTQIWPPPHDYSLDYFTIEALDTLTLTFYQYHSSLEYSTDDGTTWTSYTSSIGPFAAGTKILLKQTGSNASPIYGGFSIAATSRFNVYGNIMSLLYGDNFVGQTSLSGYHWAFKYMFSRKQVVEAGNLILPATTLSQDCYYRMFYSCSSLISAPDLPATSLAGSCYEEMFRECTSLTTAPVLPADFLDGLSRYCYYQMFYGCTSLNYVKCLANRIADTTCTQDWLNGVSATGTFVKDPTMTSWTSDASGIPAGWTIEDAQ